MKYILSFLTIALFCTATTVSAAFTYEITTDPYKNIELLGNRTGYRFRIAITGGSGYVYITDVFENRFSSEQSLVLTSDNYKLSGYGAYVYVKQELEDGTSEYVLDETRTVTHSLNDTQYKVQIPTTPGVEAAEGQPKNYPNYRYVYELGKFDADEQVEFFVLDENGDEVSSDNHNPGEYRSTYSDPDLPVTERPRTDAFDSSLPVGSLVLLSNGVRVDFGIMAVDTSFIGSGGGVFGAPLPGKLAIALIAGLFAFGFWYIRRRKAVMA